MDFTVDTKEHRAAVTAAADALPRRTGVLPALGHVRIDAEDGGLIRYSGTDLDFSIEAEVRGEVRKPGSICLPGRRLVEIARESHPDSTTRLRLAKGGASIETGPSRFQLAYSDGSDYLGGPAAVAAGSGAVAGTVASDVLAAMAARVGWITAKEETRGILCGVLIETTGSGVRMVATNTRQVGVCEAPVPDLPPGVRCVVPPQLLASALRHFDGKGPVQATFGESTVSFRTAGLTLTGRTLPGTYPDYARILPREPRAVLQMPTSTIQQAVRRTATLARERASRTVVCRVEEQGVHLWATTPELGTAYDHVEVALQGLPMTLGFHAGMLAEILEVVPTEEVRLRLHAPDKGILIDGRGDDPIRSLWMVMPLLLDEDELAAPDIVPVPDSLPSALAA